MKKTRLAFIILLMGCGSKQSDYRSAENALDAGREFIGSCLVGDFSKAAFYLVPNDSNGRELKELEAFYRQKDKEGRQQLRTASINIGAVTDLNDSTTFINYSNSLDKVPHTLQVIKRSGVWLVDRINTRK